ncbi:disease resistance protein L6-like [Malus domestica]|uniref:disease resistance protein L6-like n=1 Tax=Malus domestica TaxID=3750 RepID=UPI0039770043
MGGIGKTALTKAVFKRLSSNFEASCLPNNVREKSEQKDGVDQLQKVLLREILKEENLSTDSTFVQERLSRTKALIVLDDVSDSRQIKDLAGDNLRYGNGSRIITTSREWSVLMKAIMTERHESLRGPPHPLPPSSPHPLPPFSLLQPAPPSLLSSFLPYPSTLSSAPTYHVAVLDLTKFPSFNSLQAKV